MFCPSCGTQNLDNVNYCRTCRTDLSLVPQALSGQLQAQPQKGGRRQRNRNKVPSLGEGIQKSFVGIGFLFVSMAIMLFMPSGRLWWFWLLIPAFTMLGKGISEIVEAKQVQQRFAPPPFQQNAQPPQVHQPMIQPPPPAVDYQARKTGELVQPPPSVTESTTKLFEDR